MFVYIGILFILKHMDSTSVARILLQMLFSMKMYHWHTTSYARHQASDTFYKRAHEIIDRLVEAMVSRYGRVSQTLVTDRRFVVLTDDTASVFLEEFADYLRNVEFDSRKDSDLISIRDELLGITHQTIYLFGLQ